MTIWDQKYNTTDFLYGEQPNSFLVEQSQHIKPNSKILCLAEGEGRNAVFLAKLGHQVTAVDLSQVGLNKLHQLAQKNHVTIQTICSDLSDYPFPQDYFDVVVSIWCHLPPHLRNEVHKKVYKALRPKGLFILEAYTPKQLFYKTGGPADESLLVQLEDIKNDFPELNACLARECERFIEEGQGHKGQSAVVQFVGQK